MPSFTLSRRRALLVVVAALAVVLLASHVVSKAPAPRQAIAPLRPSAPSRAARSGIVVDVEGAVRRPGVYHLRSGARVADAIERAGGTTRAAARAAVNLAAPVADGAQILVPPRAGSSPAGAAPSAVAPGPISLSSATLEQLDALPGVGPVTAQKIIDYRTRHGPFRAVDELDAIPGIGPARLESLRGLVVP